MYCKNCGKTIEDNSTFCPYCGTNQNAAPTAAECHYDRRKDIRQSELAEINNMIAYFSPKEQQYAEFDRLSRMLGQADREIAAKPKGAIIMGIITLTFTMFGIWATAANSSGWQGFCFTVALIAALPTLVVTGVYIFNRLYWKKQKEKNAPVLAALNDELVNYYDAYRRQLSRAAQPQRDDGEQRGSHRKGSCVSREIRQKSSEILSGEFLLQITVRRRLKQKNIFENI